MSAQEIAWFEENQRYLMAAVTEVRARLENFLSCAPGAQSHLPESIEISPEPALEKLCTLFGLTSFERKILLMCAGVELDSGVARLFSGNSAYAHPVFSLALAAFEDAHWTALSPNGPLRRWQLLEVAPGPTLTASPLRIDEHILHYLAGAWRLDDRLAMIVEPPPKPRKISGAWLETAQKAARALSRSRSRLPVVQLCGADNQAIRMVAAAAASLVGLGLHIVDARRLRTGPAELHPLLRLIERESILSQSALLLDCEGIEGPNAWLESGAGALLEMMPGPLFVSTRESHMFARRHTVLFAIEQPPAAEQAEIWRETTKPAFPEMNGELAPLASQFNLSANAIRSAFDQALEEFTDGDGRRAGAEQEFAGRLWEICRRQSRPRFDGLAQRIDAVAGGDDLVLPKEQQETLREIAIHVRQRRKVYEEWGFGTNGLRGLGISALFAGPSGTGKTMACEVLANELRLDLYRIDLSQVISKYIGETEKHLRRVFDAAEEGAAILLFDEADALFGKRTEVKDSHDRYANIEVSYLLQRMECYRGLAILTTNRKSAIDPAFLRRLRFVVDFPFPDMAQRAKIWARVFPAQTPTEGLSVDRLARLNAVGGHIRNIALAAAFLAADADEPVRMAHLLSAARSEFAKLDRPLSDAEVSNWI